MTLATTSSQRARHFSALDTLWIVLFLCVVLSALGRLWIFAEDAAFVMDMSLFTGEMQPRPVRIHALFVFFGALGLTGALLYVLEGVQSAIMQTNELEKSSLLQFIRRSVDLKRQNKLNRFVEFAYGGGVNPKRLPPDLAVLPSGKQKFVVENFIVGRQILNIALVVGFVELFRALALPVTNFDDSYWGVAQVYLSTSAVVSFLQITLIQFWVSQLLPKLLASRRSLTFVAVVPLAEQAAILCYRVGRARVGAPSRFLIRNLTRGMRSIAERYEVSKETFFKKNAEFHDFHIEVHRIKLKLLEKPGAADEIALLEVSEDVEYRYTSGRFVTINHMFQTPHNAEIIEADIVPPPGCNASEPVEGRAIMRLYGSYKTAPAGTPTGQFEPVDVSKIVSISRWLETPIPKRPVNEESHEGEKVIAVVKACHEIGTVGRSDAEYHVVTIERPTRKLIVRMERDSPFIVVEPDVQYCAALGAQDVIRDYDQPFSALPKRSYSLGMDATGVSIEIDYPVTGWTYQFALNVQRRKKNDPAPPRSDASSTRGHCINNGGDLANLEQQLK